MSDRHTVEGMDIIVVGIPTPRSRARGQRCGPPKGPADAAPALYLVDSVPAPDPVEQAWLERWAPVVRAAACTEVLA